MKKRVFYLKNFESYENRKFTSNVKQKSKSAYNVSLLLLKIEHSFFQESIDNNKSMGFTMSISGSYKETQDVWSFQTDLFQKAPDQKSSKQA